MASKSDILERRQVIIEALKKTKYIDVLSLAQKLNVSEVTIRTDLANLEERGLLARTRGGAVIVEDYSVSRMFQNTIEENLTQKQKIATLAARFVNDGDTVLLDSGSTDAILAKTLKSKKITVITNSVPVITEMKDLENIELIVIGGVLRRPSLSLIGSLSNTILSTINADILFMGCTGYDIERGITTANILEGQTKQLMLKAAHTKCLIADSTKCGQVSLFSICGWDSIDYFITDSLSSDDSKTLIDNYNLKIVTE